MLPAAARPFVSFPPLLRQNGFAVSPDQTVDFMAGVDLLGPRSIGDIRQAATALLAIPHERQAEFDALFDAHFLGLALPVTLPADEDDVAAHDPTGGIEERTEIGDESDAGREAARAERLGHRSLQDRTDEALSRLRHHGAASLPRRRSRRYISARSGPLPDMRRALRDASRRDGELLTLPTRRRRERLRRIVLLIDVSGSMKERTADSLRLAHELSRIAEPLEVFTLGTRLTRVTSALRHRSAEQALGRASRLIADIDGGTRIGEALETFLAVPRFAGFARGAAVVVLSDGLERGGPEALVGATLRLSRLAWRLDWLTPLPIGGNPQTGALRAILPYLDHLGDGLTVEAICEHLLTMARR